MRAALLATWAIISNKYFLYWLNSLDSDTGFPRRESALLVAMLAAVHQCSRCHRGHDGRKEGALYVTVLLRVSFPEASMFSNSLRIRFVRRNSCCTLRFCGCYFVMLPCSRTPPDQICATELVLHLRIYVETSAIVAEHFTFRCCGCRFVKFPCSWTFTDQIHVTELVLQLRIHAETSAILGSSIGLSVVSFRL